MFKLVVRRNPKEPWSAWTTTNDIDVLIHNAIIIDACGWQWKAAVVKK